MSWELRGRGCKEARVSGMRNSMGEEEQGGVAYKDSGRGLASGSQKYGV